MSETQTALGVEAWKLRFKRLGAMGEFVPEVGGHFESRLSDGMDIGLFHEPVDTTARAMGALEDVVQTIQPQGRVFLMKPDDLPQEALVAHLALGNRPGKPGIISASGNTQYPAYSPHRDEAAMFRDEAELILYGWRMGAGNWLSTGVGQTISL